MFVSVWTNMDVFVLFCDVKEQHSSFFANLQPLKYMQEL